MVGIDDISFYVPRQYLDLKDLATKRGIEYEKLSRGLGVLKSAVPAVNEDAITMAAHAALQLIEKNSLDPRSIGRIYIGTESAVDGAKPIGSYVVGLLENYFQSRYGADCMRHCDAIDMTFACIGAVDALLNTADWCASGKNRTGIVIATDYAKYELESTGEYTQGAGAVALLVKENPRLLSLEMEKVGVACKGDHDFYKPVRNYTKSDLVSQLLENLGIDPTAIGDEKIRGLEVPGVFAAGEQEVVLHKCTPLFDGQYSNQCYADRLREAYYNYIDLGGTSLMDWAKASFHLPYAFHGKRIFNELYFLVNKENSEFVAELNALNPDFNALPYAQQLKTVSQSASYKAYTRSALDNGAKASSEIGNMYTASIFMSLVSELELSLQAGEALEGKTIGFCAYGSGSKSKVFSGKVQPEWKSVVSRWGLFRSLESRKAISFETYENWHNQAEAAEIKTPGFYLETIEKDSFIRQYSYITPSSVKAAEQPLLSQAEA